MKDRRKVVKSLIDRLKSRFNLAVAELYTGDNRKTGVIGFVVVSNEVKHIESEISKILNYIEIDLNLYSVRQEIYNFKQE